MKMSLDQTWENCLSMWKWIAKQVRKNDHDNIFTEVEMYKETWLADNGFTPGDIEADCFFCEYKRTHKKWVQGDGCGNCPGTYVDKTFSCWKTAYAYEHYPIKFYNKLVSLNRKRLKGKKKSTG